MREGAQENPVRPRIFKRNTMPLLVQKKCAAPLHVHEGGDCLFAVDDEVAVALPRGVARHAAGVDEQHAALLAHFGGVRVPVQRYIAQPLARGGGKALRAALHPVAVPVAGEDAALFDV